MRPVIILIETSTSLCSAALVEGGSVSASRFSSEPRAHAAMTAVFVKELLDERGLKVSDCDAVCLSMGPGSYTGLRVGSSTAKGLCFGGGIPLLAVNTLDVLAAQAISEGLPEGCKYIVPMIDARRMEVYSAVYSIDGERLTEVAPRVVEDMASIGLPAAAEAARAGVSGAGAELSGAGSDFSGAGAELSVAGADFSGAGANLSGAAAASGEGILFIGDGAQKCEALLGGEGRWFRQECPRADSMLQPALREWNARNFRDTAYFEPFYLKDFVAALPKKPF